MSEPAFSRVLIKLSGEALMGDQPSGVDITQADSIAKQIASVCRMGVSVAIVVGAGNFLRGSEQAAAGIDRATGDYMGMIATVLNALPIQDAVERQGLSSRVLSALDLHEVAEPYIRRRAIRHLEKGRVVIFAGGTGNPYFTTDTAAALRSLEIGADALLVAKNGIEGVYDDDPRKNPNARFLKEISHEDAVVMGLKVMDQPAFALCREHGMPIHVFNMDEKDAIARISKGERLGTLVHANAAPQTQGASR